MRPVPRKDGRWGLRTATQGEARPPVVRIAPGADINRYLLMNARHRIQGANICLAIVRLPLGAPGPFSAQTSLSAANNGKARFPPASNSRESKAPPELRPPHAWFRRTAPLTPGQPMDPGPPTEAQRSLAKWFDVGPVAVQSSIKLSCTEAACESNPIPPFFGSAINSPGEGEAPRPEPSLSLGPFHRTRLGQ
jgi:hypothetical protein